MYTSCLVKLRLWELGHDRHSWRERNRQCASSLPSLAADITNNGIWGWQLIPTSNRHSATRCWCSKLTADSMHNCLETKWTLKNFTRWNLPPVANRVFIFSNHYRLRDLVSGNLKSRGDIGPAVAVPGKKFRFKLGSTFSCRSGIVFPCGSCFLRSKVLGVFPLYNQP